MKTWEKANKTIKQDVEKLLAEWQRILRMIKQTPMSRNCNKSGKIQVYQYQLPILIITINITEYMDYSVWILYTQLLLVGQISISHIG